jgi:outer membrane protein assembly factor BamD (BamD/ComL family)
VAAAETIEGIDQRVINWARANRRTVTIGLGVAAVAVGGILFWRAASERRENFAERALQTARSAAEAGNLPLAASDLARLIGTYGGTRAAQEGSLLLAQIRLLDNQATIAAADLQTFIQSGPRREFRAPASGLLGAALEESGRFGEAARAYEDAAAATPYAGVRNQHLLDAARAHTMARDTASATAVYQRILSLAESGADSIEPLIRISELRKGA